MPRWGPRLDNLTPEVQVKEKAKIIRLYVEEDLTIDRIHERTRYGVAAITRVLREAGVNIRNSRRFSA